MILLLLGISTISNAKPIKVLEVDTGVDISAPDLRNHVNISNWTKDDYIDLHGHGTHIAGLILKDVCNEVELISCKYFSETNTGEENLAKTIACFKQGLVQKVDIINYSAGGLKPYKDEYLVLKKLSDSGIKIIVAAGNNGEDLSIFDYFPAQYPLQNIIVVGNMDKNKKRNVLSNYGLNGMVWEMGTEVWSNLPHNSFGYMTGTSQATAKRTNRILKRMCLHE